MVQIFKKINIKNNIHESILVVLAIFYNIYFTIATFLKYENYYTGRFDLGNMTQTVWNTLHGRVFLLTNPDGTEEISRLAFHADFILILFTPLYLIWEDPRTLLLVQTLIISLGGIFVYLIAKEILKEKNLSLILAFCFFINPAVNYTNLFDFHSVTLATSFFLIAFYYVLKKKYWVTTIFLFLAGITKEQTWAIIALFGLYLTFVDKKIKLGGLIFVFSITMFVLLFWYLIPNTLGQQHFATKFFGDFGDSPGKIIKGIVTDPKLTLNTLLEYDRILHIKRLFMPLGYLSILGFPFLIFAAPDLTINLLSGSPQMHQIYYQYSATITPFIFISTIYGIKWLKNFLPEIPYKPIGIALLIFSYLSAYTYGPLPFAKKPSDAMFKKKLSNRSSVDNYLKRIPLDEKLSATNNLGSHLSHRRFIYTIPVGIEKADKVLFLTEHFTNGKENETLRQLLSNKDYKLIFSDQDFYVFQNLKAGIK